MLGEIRAMQVYTMTRKNSKNCKKYLHSTISYKYKIVLWKFFYAGSQIRAVQIRAMRNRASRGMTVHASKYVHIYLTRLLKAECHPELQHWQILEKKSILHQSYG